MDKIRADLVFEILGRPAEHIKTALDTLIEIDVGSNTTMGAGAILTAGTFEIFSPNVAVIDWKNPNGKPGTLQISNCKFTFHNGPPKGLLYLSNDFTNPGSVIVRDSTFCGAGVAFVSTWPLLNLSGHVMPASCLYHVENCFGINPVGFITAPSLPSGFGINNGTRNSYFSPVIIYLPNATPYGIVLMDYLGNQKTLSDAQTIFLGVSDWIWFTTAIPTSWVWYVT